MKNFKTMLFFSWRVSFFSLHLCSEILWSGRALHAPRPPHRVVAFSSKQQFWSFCPMLQVPVPAAVRVSASCRYSPGAPAPKGLRLCERCDVCPPGKRGCTSSSGGRASQGTLGSVPTAGSLSCITGRPLVKADKLHCCSFQMRDYVWWYEFRVGGDSAPHRGKIAEQCSFWESCV